MYVEFDAEAYPGSSSARLDSEAASVGSSAGLDFGGFTVGTSFGLDGEGCMSGVYVELDENDVEYPVPVNPYEEEFLDSDGTSKGGPEGNLGRMASAPQFDVTAKTA